MIRMRLFALLTTCLMIPMTCCLADTPTLTICNANSNTEALFYFTLRHPELPVTVETQDTLTTGAIAAYIQGGGSDIDIFYLPDSQGLGALIDKGFAAKIHHQIVTDSLGRMTPAVRRALTRSDAVYGVPGTLDAQIIGYHREALAWFGLAQPSTFPQLVRLYADWLALDPSIREGMVFDAALGDDTAAYPRHLLEIGLAQYAMTYEAQGQPVTFNTPAFRALLTQLATLPADDAPTHWDGNLDRSLVNTDMFTYAWADVPGWATVHTPAMIPGFTTKNTQANLGVYLLNPLSRNKAQAQVFLATILDYALIKSRYLLYTDLDTPSEYASYQATVDAVSGEMDELADKLATATGNERIALEEALSEAADYLSYAHTFERYAVSVSDLPTLRAIGDTLFFRDGSLLSQADSQGADALWTVLDRFLAGQSSVDQTVIDLEQKVRMMYSEAR